MSRRGLVKIDVEIAGQDEEAEVLVHEGEVITATLAGGLLVVLTRAEEERAVESWLYRRELRHDAHEHDAFDRAGDR